MSVSVPECSTEHSSSSSSHVLYILLDIRIHLYLYAQASELVQVGIITVLSMYSLKTADMYPYCMYAVTICIFCKAECKAGYVRIGSVSPEARGCLITLSVCGGLLTLLELEGRPPFFQSTDARYYSNAICNPLAHAQSISARVPTTCMHT